MGVRSFLQLNRGRQRQLFFRCESKNILVALCFSNRSLVLCIWRTKQEPSQISQPALSFESSAKRLSPGACQASSPDASGANGADPLGVPLSTKAPGTPPRGQKRKDSRSTCPVLLTCPFSTSNFSKSSILA